MSSSSLLQPRAINKLLIANRGEIAVRILNAARELPDPVETFALYTAGDRSHCDLGHPDHAIQIASPTSYLDITTLVEIVKKHSIDTIHPGYGFLSESAEFAQRMWEEANAIVIGPGPENLAQTGDKLKAKALAQTCGVPVLEAMARPTADVDEARAFARKIGFPVMVKAVDGGGGRGIRLVREDSELENSLQRAIGESPSKTVFLEKAAVDGFHHVEIQVLGDGTGNVRHLWERDCRDRDLISRVIDSALRMASHIQYHSLGTFEFLVSEQTGEFFFLEINPRLQVEHTITEAISGIDLVQTQLLLAQGHTFADLGLGSKDASQDFALSIGKITTFHIPTGNGIRIDTHISNLAPLVVGSDFDNLLAKIVVTASTWKAAVRKAQRVLSDTNISGVNTNLVLLRGIVAHADFLAGSIDTQWLGKQLQEAYKLGEQVTKQAAGKVSSLGVSQSSSAPAAVPSSSLLFRKGDAWSITLQPLQQAKAQGQQVSHHLRLSRVLRNEFPSTLAAEIEYTTPNSKAPLPFRVQIDATSTTASALVSSHRRGDRNNPSHIVLPLSGKLIEVLVSSGEDVAENQVLAFVKQMKMELEVRSPRAGKIKWAYEMEDEEEDVSEGMLLVELQEPIRGKL
ncbi:hypothetical protein N7468_008012 [Penicillium chermesinum]|uniref:Pyruvate carboxylase n=1 Tax=Penicillium chermesinum TaxID=63820 RepID=A0A9W9NP40_9EURO|nr:uncharacterized protein N7468_008012 [Penicillium chermesinum]KAJ5223470.1 hypothetical protein N7468_008012 [Penicillium chermesinum]